MAKRKVSRAVGEDHAPEEVEADTPERKRWRALNWYATPPWGSRAGAVLLRELDPAAKSVWEPACGDGIMAAVLRDYFDEVHQSDLELQPGLAQSNMAFQFDYLLDKGGPEVDWIFTNPPFIHAADFIRLGLERASRGVAVLCRTSFMEAEERYSLLYTGDNPMTVAAPFIERLPMHLGPWEPNRSTATAYAWFYFRKSPHRKAQGFRPSPPVVMPFAPGTRNSLTFPDDVRRFVAPVMGTLL